MQSNSVNGQPDIANITVVTDERQVIVPQAITSVVEVNNPGPQGPVGPQGETGPSVPFTNIGNDVYATTSSLQVTGSFLVSGSSTFTNIGPAIFSGSTAVSGSLIVNGYDVVTVNQTSSMSVATASYLNTLNQDLTFNGNLTLNGTASISTLVVNQTQYSSGSNQLGDAANDTQTLFGSVIIPTGSLTVTGSAIINTLTVGLGGGQQSTNTAIGVNALSQNTTGTANTAVGYLALASNNTTGTSNSAFGYLTMRFSTGGSNSAFGTTALYGITGGSNNSAFGRDAGYYIADGVTAATTLNTSVFIGANTKALANNQSNQIVIGQNAIGLGNNSAVLGNDSITRTALKGDISIGTTGSISSRLHVQGSGTTSATTALRVENTNASASLVVLDNGFVGIGTSSAQYQLDVYGTYHQYQAQGGLARYDISSANANQNRGVWDFYTNAAVAPDFFGRFGFKFEGGTADSFKQFQVHVADSTTPKFVVDGSGRVGIGTTSSLTILDVRTTNNSSITPLSIAPNDATTLLVGNTGTNGVLAFGQNNTGQGWIQGRSRLAGASANPILLNPLGGNILVGTTTDSGAKLHISGSTTEALLIASSSNGPALFVSGSGNVSIGTSTPLFGRLEIFGGVTNFRNANGLNTLFEQTRFSRSDSILNVRYHSISTTHSNVSANNEMQFLIHSAATDTAQVAPLIIKGNGNAQILNNLLIGTTTDSARLMVKGSGTTSGTTALRVENANTSASLIVRDDGNVLSGNIIALNGAISISSTGGGVAGNYIILNNGGFNFTNTSSNINHIRFTSTFAPTSGTGTYVQTAIEPTINQTGGANGITRGLYINPTLTAAADFRAIETTAGEIIFGGTDGILIPRLTTTQRDAIVSPATGLQIFNSTEGYTEYYDSFWGWIPLGNQNEWKRKWGTEYFNDFGANNAFTGDGVFQTFPVNGGSYMSFSPLPTGNDYIGFLGLATGLNSNGQNAIRTDLNTGIFFRPAFRISLISRLWLQTLSDATNRYNVIFGLSQGANSTINNGCVFIYDEGGVGTGTTVSPNWQIITAVGSVRTNFVTSVPVAINTWYSFRIESNSTFTEIYYYINDVLVRTETTNIPTSITNNPIVSITKTAGTTNRAVAVDYLGLKVKLNSSR